MTAGVVGDDRVRHPVLGQFPGGEARALVPRAGFIDPHVDGNPGIVRRVDRRGGGADIVTWGATLEELGRLCEDGSLPFLLSLRSAVASAIFEVASPAIVERYVRPMASGGRFGSFAYSEDAVLGHAFATPFEYVLGGRDIPIIPFFTNVYMPPLPSARRCAALGGALARIIQERPERVAIIASGGMSHYPGTWKYPTPEYDFDRWMIAQFEIGNLDALLNMSPEQLDEVGNTEMLTWAMMFGAIGSTSGELLQYTPTWHHGHGFMRFLPARPRKAPRLEALEERGFIRRLPNRARAIEVIKLPDSVNQGMGGRKQEMIARADAFVALPGGFGTMDEALSRRPRSR